MTFGNNSTGWPRVLPSQILNMPVVHDMINIITALYCLVVCWRIDVKTWIRGSSVLVGFWLFSSVCFRRYRPEWLTTRQLSIG